MGTLADLERRVCAHDNTLTPADFVRAHSRIDALYAQHAEDLKRRSDEFSKRRVFGPRVAKVVELIGKELALPVADR